METATMEATEVNGDRAGPAAAKGGDGAGGSGDARLSDLLNKVEQTLGGKEIAAERCAANGFVPRQPQSLAEAGLTAEEVEKLICKFLFARGAVPGRRIAEHIGLAFGVMDPLLRQLKTELVLAYKNAAAVNDYEYMLTDLGRERARRYSEECSYFGAAPVPLKDYVASVASQTITGQAVGEAELRHAFADLIVGDEMMRRLGPAINSGRGLFLYGAPGNGKTSIAERITRCFGSDIWIPRALGVDGLIMRLFDPVNHEEIEETSNSMLQQEKDRRWVRVKRPTIVVGGELTMAELEVQQNPLTKISEAPLQLKSNCGTLVIDDFGRQRMSSAELLNRWIVPLEKRYDFLNLANGKKIQVPFDQFLIFSTNLQPKDLVDEAFLRRIPYKIQVPDPSPDAFRKMFEIMSSKLGFPPSAEAMEYLIRKHYQECGRAMRSCHPRDLVLQTRNYCLYHRRPLALTTEALDFAVENYFTVL